jgi:hypothetical protein
MILKLSLCQQQNPANMVATMPTYVQPNDIFCWYYTVDGDSYCP